MTESNPEIVESGHNGVVGRLTREVEVNVAEVMSEDLVLRGDEL